MQTTFAALTSMRMEVLNEQEVVLLKKASVCGKIFETALLKLLSTTMTTAEASSRMVSFLNPKAV
ncbi:hypothetical protein HPB48_020331 [Haemaphysalis longicornis]|uniref:Uncharacterized protein n=1 Tax=Haemaphysalis longicornis TaxID=44386 RepID=A0A9J6GFR8_HAELO|nr:hypothetical protein HPB48_020331 [Haemaphysalis longicornis]